MNNMKGKGIIIAGIIFSLAGIGIAGVSAKFAYDDVEELVKDAKIKHGHYDLTENDKITIECNAGTMNVYRSETGTSYVDYDIYDFFYCKYDSEDNELKAGLQKKYWWLFWKNLDKNVVNVYLAGDDYEAYLDLNAGKFTINDDLNFKSLDLDVSAGKFVTNNTLTVEKSADIYISAGDININNLVVGEDALLKVSAGDFDIDNLTVNGNAEFKVSAGDLTVKKASVTGNSTLNVSAGDMTFAELKTKKMEARVSAGDIKIDKLESDDIKFNISAGDITMKLVGSVDEFNIDIDKSAGSCNLDKAERHQKVTGSDKKIEGDISAGKATILFTD